MSTILAALRRILATLAAPQRASADIDALSLRDWADLPVHHPLCDRTPC